MIMCAGDTYLLPSPFFYLLSILLSHTPFHSYSHPLLPPPPSNTLPLSPSLPLFLFLTPSGYELKSRQLARLKHMALVLAQARQPNQLTNPTNPTLTNPTLTNPTLTNPTLTNPTNPTLTN